MLSTFLVLLNALSFASAIDYNLGDALEGFFNVMRGLHRKDCADDLVKKSISYIGERRRRNDTINMELYLKTFANEQPGLHFKPIEEFESLRDTHLIYRYAEYASLTSCDFVKHVKPLADFNLRVGQFHVDDYGLDKRGYVIWLLLTNLAQRTTVLAFRGTHQPSDVIIDLGTEGTIPDPALLPSKQDGSDQVHEGFYTRFLLVYRSAAKAVKKVLAERNTKLVVTGHSLGGTSAMLFSYHLAEVETIKPHAVYVYGMPFFGTKSFVDRVVHSLGADNIVLTVNGWDLVPHIGLYPGGVQPNVTEVWFPSGSDTPQICTVSCSAQSTCEQWSWSYHSSLGTSFQYGSRFCNINKPI